MRRLVKQKDLIYTLNELVSKKDPEIVSVYREVMMYRFSRKKTDYLHVEKNMMVYSKMWLSLFNIFLAGAAAILCVVCMIHQANPLPFALGILGLACFALWQMRAFERNRGKLASVMPYILIDEMIRRKIIVLAPRNKKAESKIKTAK